MLIPASGQSVKSGYTSATITMFYPGNTKPETLIIKEDDNLWEWYRNNDGCLYINKKDKSELTIFCGTYKIKRTAL